MEATDFNLGDDFSAVSYEQWRALAEADLRGASFEQKLVTHAYEGIDIQPLYCRRDEIGPSDPFGFPGAPPFVRGSDSLDAARTGWDLRQEYAVPDLTLANRAIVEDLAGGATSVSLRLDLAARNGFDPDHAAATELAGRDGLMVYGVDDLDAVLSGVALDRVGVSLEAGAAFLPAAAALAALWKRRKVPPDKAKGSFNADPLATLACEGRLSLSRSAAIDELGKLAVWTSRNYPGVTAVGVDTAPYHHAGATVAQDIACTLATAVEYLRAMSAAGLPIDAAAGQILFQFSLGTRHFLAISKLRAARLAWSRVVSSCGGSPAAGAMRIHARISDRVLTRRDPYVNLLRNTAGVFAAGLGGADSITSAPFDTLLGPPDDFSRRVARNTLLILQEEAHLNRVIDPAGGSWFLDRLTQQLAEKAWSVFQQIEERGGMGEVLATGWIAEQIAVAFAPRAKNIARRKEGITGVSEFPNVREERVAVAPVDLSELRKAAVQKIKKHRREDGPLQSLVGASDPMAAAIEAAAAGASLGQIATSLGFHLEAVEIVPLEVRGFAEPFEELRDASDHWAAIHGKRPAVFLANMGPVSQHTARATYAKNFFEAGGFDVIGNDGFREAAAATKAFVASGARIAVICSSDKLYPEVVPQLAGQLKAAKARSVVLAGNPGANELAWRAAGVDRFIFVRCDVLATLREMLQEVGVLGKDEG